PPCTRHQNQQVFFLLVPGDIDAFFELRPPLPSFSFSLTLGCFGSPSSDLGLPLRTGSACSGFRLPPTRFPADLPLRCKAPRPERPIPPQTTHTSSLSPTVCIADTQRIALCFSASHPILYAALKTRPPCLRSSWNAWKYEKLD
ncbi:hypothetical protein B0H14DRAFT_2526631, partial [Mycena olivaceomarginata]